MNQTIYIIIILVCLIFSGYFSATETAFSTFNKIRMKTYADKGNKRAKSVLKLADNYDGLLTTILIGNNLVNILMASMATLLFIEWMGDATGPTVSTIVTTIVVLIFGEVTPKSVAKERPEKFAMFAEPLIKFLMYLFIPFVFLFKGWKALVSKLLKSEEDEKMTEEELISMVKEAEQEGEFDEDEGQIIKSAIEFNELEIGDIFTPRIDVTAIPVNTKIDQIAKTFMDTGYSRIPVYKDNFDNFIGILHYKDFFATKEKSEGEFDITPLLKPVIYLSKNQLINDVLKDFQAKQVHFGVILDEFGSIGGIVTLEDILEEIVGEIWDEHDQIEDEIKEIKENEYQVSGKTSTVKLFNYLEMDEEVDALTVNGWVMDCINRIPSVNDEFNFKDLNIKVIKMNGKRVGIVQIIDNRIEEDEDEDDGFKNIFSRKDKDEEDEESEDK